MSLLLRLLLLAVIAAWGESSSAHAAPPESRHAIRSFLDDLALGHKSLAGQTGTSVKALSVFYARRQYTPAWSPTAEEQLTVLLNNASHEGLNPEDYAVAAPGSLSSPGKRDVLLSHAFLLYASHLAGGRVCPDTLQSSWLQDVRVETLTDALARGLNSGDVRGVLKSLRPPGPEYLALKSHLARLQSIRDRGGWPRIPPGPTLRPGDRNPRVARLRDRLAFEDRDIPAPLGSANTFDSGLVEAVRDFQERYGLEVDGLVGPKTVASLNRPVEDRIRTVLVNLERWKWFPQDMGRRHARVNIPGFTLDLVDSGSVILSMKVVVGRPNRPTPLFSDSIEYLVLAPYWNIPINLALRDKVPEILNDPEYLGREGIRVMSGWGSKATEVPADSVDWGALTKENFEHYLRQDPGPLNALGDMKFMFPNQFKVYLHDTPTRWHFEEPSRAYSSGCIRLERPWDLARYLLQGKPDWNDERLQEVIEAGEPKHVAVPHPLPIHLIYLTAWCDSQGRLHLRPDIYGHDPEVYAAMKRAGLLLGSAILPGTEP